MNPVPVANSGALLEQGKHRSKFAKALHAEKQFTKAYWKEHARSLYFHPSGMPRNARPPFGRVWRAIIAEFFGTMIFVFFATGAASIAVIVNPDKNGTAILIVAIGQAFALVIALYSIGHVSGGHVNPAVTLAVFLVGRIDIIRAILYIAVQIGGAIIGSLFLKAILPGRFEGVTNLGATTLAPGYGQGTGLLLESIMTFTLVWVIWATAIDPDGFGKLAPLAIGLVLIGDLIVGWLFTGSGMNPARSIGPAIVANVWDDHWIYWAGPIIGAVLAAIIYDFILMSRPANPAPAIQGTRMETQTPGQLQAKNNTGLEGDMLERRGPSPPSAPKPVPVQ